MLPGTLAMMPRQYVEYTVMARKSPVTSIALWLIILLKRRSMIGRFPSRACQVGHFSRLFQVYFSTNCCPVRNPGCDTRGGLGHDSKAIIRMAEDPPVLIIKETGLVVESKFNKKS